MKLLLNSNMLNRNTLLAVYCNNSSTDKFIVGYPVAVGVDFIILSLIDKDANYDGLSLCFAASVFRIEYGSNYLAKLQHKLPEEPTWSFTGDPCEYYLTDLENNRRIVEIKDESGSRLMFGILLSHTETSLRVQSVTPAGKHGTVYEIERTLIAQLNCDSSKEEAIQHQFERSNSFAK